jgi:hypothetical protein
VGLDIALVDADGKEVFDAYVTHNLVRMADEAGIYGCVWRPEDYGITHAHQLIGSLSAGLAKLATEKARFVAFNSENGFGRWDEFVIWCADYLQACRDYPYARVEAGR